MNPAADHSAPSRRAYIDWARGLAVLVMIQAHALDAWTRPADRSSTLYGYLLLVGGFAAPLFLWLAGLGVSLSAETVVRRGGTRRAAVEAAIKRGAEIFILAFLFRLQAFVVSPGSWPVTLFRVDILNVMGPAIAATGILWGLSGGRWRAAVACAVAAAAIAMATPPVRSAGWVSWLPMWFQWYLRPSADHTTFTLLPWAGFVFAGAAAGAVMPTASTAASDRRWMTGFASSAVVAIALGLYTSRLPTIYESSSFWTSSPTYFAIRVGIVMLALLVCYLMVPLGRAAAGPFAVLSRIGRNSLFIYWIHVELVYGYTTWAIHRRLPLWGALAGYVVFCLAMYLAIGVRDTVAEWWRSRNPVKPIKPSRTPSPARV